MRVFLIIAFSAALIAISLGAPDPTEVKEIDKKSGTNVDKILRDRAGALETLNYDLDALIKLVIELCYTFVSSESVVGTADRRSLLDPRNFLDARRFLVYSQAVAVDLANVFGNGLKDLFACVHYVFVEPGINPAELTKQIISAIYGSLGFLPEYMADGIMKNN